MLLRLLILLLVVASSGCAATSARVWVDAEGLGEAVEGTRYTIRPAPGVVPGSARWQLATALIDRVLAERGLLAVSGGDSEVTLFLGYGVGTPETRISRTFVPRLGFHYHGGRGGPWLYGGGHIRVHRQTTVSRYLHLEAFTGETRDGSPLWRVSAVSSGRDADLTRDLPPLVWAMGKYIGGDTAGAERVGVNLRSQEYEKFRDAALPISP